MAFETGTIAIPGSTGLQQITSLSFQPKWIIFFGTRNTTLETVDPAVVNKTYGFATATKQASIAWAGALALGNFDVAHGNDDAACILTVDKNAITDVRAVFSQFLSNGFELNWTKVNGGNIFFIASDEGSTFDIIKYSTGTTSPALSFQADLLVSIYSGTNNGSADFVNNDSGIGISFANAAQQQAVGLWAEEGTVNAPADQQAKFMTIPTQYLATLDAITGSGFDLTWDADAGTNSTVYTFAIQGLDSDISTFIQGVVEVETGIPVNGLMLAANGTSQSFGVGDGTLERSDWIMAEDAGTPDTKDNMTENSILELRDTDGALLADATGSSFSGSKFNLTWPTDDSSGQSIIYCAIARGPTTINLSPSSTITLTQNNQLPATVIAALNRLGIDHEALTNVDQETIEQLLNLTQEAESSIKMLEALNTIALTGEADFAETIFECLTNGIAFEQTLTSEQFSQVFESLLALTQQIDIKINNDHLLAPVNILDLTQSTEIDKAIRIDLPFGPGVGRLLLTQSVKVAGSQRVSAASSITFNQSLNKVLELTRTIDQGLALSQKAGRNFFPTASSDLDLFTEAFRRQTPENELSLIQTALGVASKDTKSVLDFSQTLSFLKNFLPLITQNLNLKQSATYQTDASDIDCTYSPFVGEVTSGITPPSTTAPILGEAVLTLTFPFMSPTTTLELRNPEFTNTDNLNFNRINRTTRGGTLVIFADPEWPKEQRLAVQIDVLTEQQVSDLQDFIAESLGKEIGLLDHENRQWKGIIVTPDLEITHVARKNFSVSFEFEGELV